MPIDVPLNLAYVHELAGSPKETYRKEGLTAQRLFLLPWEMRAAFADAALQTTGLVPRLGVQYPDRIDVLVEEVAFEPFLGSGSCPAAQAFTNLSIDLNEYLGFGPGATNGCLATVSYSRPDPPDDQPDGTSLRYSRTSSFQVMTINSLPLKWSDDTYLPDDSYPGVMDTIVDHTMTWSNVSSPPWVIIKEMHGAVNDSLFSFPASYGEFAYPETLQFNGSSTKFEFNPSKSQFPSFELTYVFRERTTTAMLPDGTVSTIGWNHMLRTDDIVVGWDRPTFDISGGGKGTLLQQKNFALLFIQGS